MADPPDFDLQAHSTYSDGTLAPVDVVARAAAAGVRLLALTDHDSLEGVDEAVAAGHAMGVAVVGACEITTLTGAGENRHILAYRVGAGNPQMDAVLASSRDERRTRANRIVASLRELGFTVDEGSIERLRAAGLPIGRPHLASAVVGDPANHPRLKSEGCLGMSDFLEAYLIPGRPAYCPRAAPTVAQAIELIHQAGGFAVWAHPFWELHDAAEVRAEFDTCVALGIDGVEAFYVTHTPDEVRLLHSWATEADLLITGSADFHGPEHARFNRFRTFDLLDLEPRLGAIDARPAG